MIRYFRNGNFICGLLLVLLLAGICAISVFYTPHEPNLVDYELRNLPPGRDYLCGTDNFGRDIFSRLMVGSQVTFTVGFFSVAISLGLGLLLGAFSGYYGGVADAVVNRLIELIMTFPTVLFALMLIAVFGGGTLNLIMILGISAMPRFARLIRAGYLQARAFEYVKSARMKGAGDLRILFLHILPNIRTPIVVNCSFTFSLSVLTESALSYLGLGIQPPDASWGRMLYEAQPLLQQSPWYAVFTGVPIILMVLGFNLLGDGVNEVHNG